MRLAHLYVNPQFMHGPEGDILKVRLADAGDPVGQGIPRDCQLPGAAARLRRKAHGDMRGGQAPLSCGERGQPTSAHCEGYGVGRERLSISMVHSPRAGNERAAECNVLGERVGNHRGVDRFGCAKAWRGEWPGDRRIADRVGRSAPEEHGRIEGGRDGRESAQRSDSQVRRRQGGNNCMSDEKERIIGKESPTL
jgi:hypothetical protein